MPTHKTQELQNLKTPTSGQATRLLNFAMKRVLAQEGIVLLLLHALRHGLLILGRRVSAWWLTERARFSTLKCYDNNVSFGLFSHWSASLKVEVG